MIDNVFSTQNMTYIHTSVQKFGVISDSKDFNNLRKKLYIKKKMLFPLNILFIKESCKKCHVLHKEAAAQLFSTLIRNKKFLEHQICILGIYILLF